MSGLTRHPVWMLWDPHAFVRSVGVILFPLERDTAPSQGRRSKDDATLLEVSP